MCCFVFFVLLVSKALRQKIFLLQRCDSSPGKSLMAASVVGRGPVLAARASPCAGSIGKTVYEQVLSQYLE
jgi:hypothetical protein